MTNEEFKEFVHPVDSFFEIMSYVGPFVLISVGTAIIIWRIYKSLRYKYRKVEEVTATVLDSTIESYLRHKSDGATMMYKPMVEYSYETRGNRFVSSKMYFGLDWHATSEKYEAEHIVNRYKKSTHVTAYVFKNDPSISYLEAAPQRSWKLYIIGVVFIAMGYFFWGR